MTFTVETEREAPGKWIADIPVLPGCMVYGRTKTVAVARVKRLAMRVLRLMLAEAKCR